MRYAIVMDPDSEVYVQVMSKAIATLEGNTFTIRYATGRQDSKVDMRYQDEDGVCISIQNDVLHPVTSKPLSITSLFLPETHPLFNYGIITDVYFESGWASIYIKDRLKSVFNQKLVDLYYKLLHDSHNNK